VAGTGSPHRKYLGRLSAGYAALRQAQTPENQHNPGRHAAPTGSPLKINEEKQMLQGFRRRLTRVIPLGLLCAALTTAAVAGDADFADANGRLDAFQMFMHADIVVKVVMIFLGLCSVLTWAILIEKSLLMFRVNGSTRRFLDAFRHARKVENIIEQTAEVGDNPMGRMWQAAKDEWDLFHRNWATRTITPHQTDRLIQRMALAAGIVQERELSRLGTSMGILATIGSTSPFIGLFGTVWGILHSFAQIASSKSTSLTVVAPGIAEALLATAIGLFAAIPAVMIYNKFARDIAKVTGALDNFTAEFTAVVSRELEEVG
jgi:TolQ protein